MKRLNRQGREGVLHYFTINVRDGAHAFAQDAYARAAATVLRAQCNRYPARLIAYVVMPTHLHGIANPRDGDIEHFLSTFKPAVTRMVEAIARESKQQRVLDWLILPDGHRQLWQESKHNFHLWSERLIWQKINYMHANPIRAGLAPTMADYLYSSYRAMYEVEREVLVPIDRNFWWMEE